MAETTVGSIVGFLRMDASEFIAAMERAILLTDKLDGKKVDVKVDADTASAQAQLAILKERLDSVDESNAKVKASSREAAGSGGMGALIAAAVALGPALVPLAAGAAGLGTAFVAMGAAGAVAIKGVKDQMDEATPVGRAFSAGLQVLSGDLDKLAANAAPRVLASFQDGVRQLNGSMPQLNVLTGDLATVAGKAGVNIVSGLLSGLQQATPLLQTGSVEVLRLSTSFSTLMASGGVKDFASYATSVLPQVVTTIEDLTTTAGHLVVALAPMGGAALSAIQSLSQAINAIPVPVLETLATVGVSAFIGFKTAGAISAGVSAFGDSLTKVGVSAERAAGGMRILEAASGPIGIAIAAASLALSYFSEQSREGQQTVDNLTEAFKASHGAIDQHIKDLQYTALQQDGTVDSAKRLGLSLFDLTQASLGNADAYARVQAQMKALQYEANHLQWGSDKANQMNTDLTNVRSGIDATTKSLQSGRQGYVDWNAAMTSASGTTVQADAATVRLAASLGVSVTALEAMRTSMQGQAASTSNATLQMRLQNDAAGLLRAGLDLLNGKVLNVEEAQTRSAQATQNATKTIHDNKSALDLNSAAGVANRAAIEQAAQAAQAQAVAVATQTGSQTKANGVILAGRDALIAQLKAQGTLTPAIQAYIDKLYAVPKTVKTAIEVQADQAAARLASLKAMLDSLHDKTINVTTLAQTKNILGNTLSAGMQAATRADGGLTLANGVRAMAAGGLLNREAMVTSRPILWGEAGPEAYIPLSPAKRARSTALLAATNQAMGDPLQAGGRVFNNTFHLSETNPYVLADQIARTIAFASI